MLTKSFEFSDPHFRGSYLRLVILKMLTGLVDLLALGVFASLGQIAVDSDARFSGSQHGLAIRVVKNLLGSDISRSRAIVVVALLGLGLFAIKSVTSLVISSRLHKRLAEMEVAIGTTLYDRLLTRQVDSLKLVESQSIAQALSTGVSAASIRALSFLATIIGEIALLTVVGVLFLWIEPLLTLILGAYFGLLAFVLHRLVSRPSERFGYLLGDSTIDTTRIIQESLRTARELRTLGKSRHPVKLYSKAKQTASSAHARLLTLVYVPRQVIDTALILGVAISAAILFAQYETDKALQSVAFLLVAGTRLAPSLLALQGAQSSLRIALGEASHLYILMETTGLTANNDDSSTLAPSMPRSDSDVLISAEHLSYSYPGTRQPALSDLSFSIRRGSFTAIVGPSGSGKTTLVDLLLGLLTPSGRIEIGGEAPGMYVRQFPGRVGYVPQDSALITGTLAENVALGHELGDIDNQQVMASLEKVGLGEFVNSLKDGVSTPTGEYGGLLSGGQRQRVGLARALYTNPEILVLDESTSALDADSERVILDLLQEFRGRLTIVMIAHKMSSIRSADYVLALESGRLVGQGTYDELAQSVHFLTRNTGSL